MRRQSGITFIGWLVLLTPFVIVLYAGIRLTPVYLNYLKVSHTLTEVAGEFGNGGASVSTIQTSIERHFVIDSVSYPKLKDISITHSSAGWQLEAAYYDYAPLFANISLQIAFDKTVTFHSGG